MKQKENKGQKLREIFLVLLAALAGILGWIGRAAEGILGRTAELIQRAVKAVIRKERIRRRKRKKNRIRFQKRHTAEEYRSYRIREILEDLVHYGVWVLGISVLVITVGSAGGAMRRAFTPKPEVEPEIVAEEPAFPEKDIVFGSTGSHMLHDALLASYTEDGVSYDFSEIFRYIRPYYSAPDFMTCEFEGSLSGGYYSGYPMFQSPDDIVRCLQGSGVDLVMLATNHIYDSWTDGFQRTMDTLDKMGIRYLGIRQRESDKRYYIADVDGIRIGFTNYVYETSSYTNGSKSLNGLVIPDADVNRICSFDPDDEASIQNFYREMRENIAGMRRDGAQYLVAQMHWGTEYHLEESAYQRKIAAKLCEMGIDALIGGHPHCEQPMDMLTSADGTHSMYCIYSEGNALSNQRAELVWNNMPTGHTEDGVIVNLSLHQNGEGEVALTNVEMIPTWVYRYMDEMGLYKYYILPLDDVSHLEEKTGLHGIAEYAGKSRSRTVEELQAGLAKVNGCLKVES